MSSRRNLRAAGRWILPAVIFVAAGSTPPLHAQSEPATARSRRRAELALARAAAARMAAPAADRTSTRAAEWPGVRRTRHARRADDGPDPGRIVRAGDTARTERGNETIVPGAQQTVLPASPETPAAIVPASITQPPTAPAPTTAGSVFDAPNMPGVRMMAPIPDNQPVVTSPTAVSTPIPTPRPSSTSTANRGLLDQTVTAAKNGEWTRATNLAVQTGSRPAQLFVEWLYLSDAGTDATFGQLSAFLSAHPNWPRREAMLTNAEEAMPADVDPQAGGRVVRRPRAAHADGHDPSRRSASRLRQPRTRNRIDPQGVVRGFLQCIGRGRDPRRSWRHPARSRSSREAGPAPFGRRHRGRAASDRTRRRNVAASGRRASQDQERPGCGREHHGVVARGAACQSRAPARCIARLSPPRQGRRGVSDPAEDAGRQHRRQFARRLVERTPDTDARRAEG